MSSAIEFIETNDPELGFDLMLEARVAGQVIADVRESREDFGGWVLTLHRSDLDEQHLAAIAARFADWVAEAEQDLPDGESRADHEVALMRSAPEDAIEAFPPAIGDLSDGATSFCWRVRLRHRGFNLHPKMGILAFSRALWSLLLQRLERPDHPGRFVVEEGSAPIAIEALPLPAGQLFLRLANGITVPGRPSRWAARLAAVLRLAADSVAVGETWVDSYRRACLFLHAARWDGLCLRLEGEPAPPKLREKDSQRFARALGVPGEAMGWAGMRPPSTMAPIEVAGYLMAASPGSGFSRTTATQLMGASVDADSAIGMWLGWGAEGAPTPAWQPLLAFLRRLSSATGRVVLFDDGGAGSIELGPTLPTAAVSPDPPRRWWRSRPAGTPLDAPLPTVEPGHIELCERVAVTALSQVYRAHVDGRLCALKVARQRYEPTLVGTHDTEAVVGNTGTKLPSPIDPTAVLSCQYDFLRQLDLPFVPKLHGYLELRLNGEPRKAIAMDWVPGRPAVDPALPIRQRLYNVGLIAQHLLTLHERGIVWEDLKPDHARFWRGAVVLLDPANGVASLDISGARIYTPAYNRPLMLDAGHPSVPTLATLLLEALLGRYPFDRRTPEPLPVAPLLAMVAAHFEGAPPYAFPLGCFPRCPEPVWDPVHRLALAGHQGVLRDGRVHPAAEGCMPSLEAFAELVFASAASPPDWDRADAAYDHLVDRAESLREGEGAAAIAHLEGLVRGALQARRLPLAIYSAAVTARKMRPAPRGYDAALMAVANALGAPTPPSEDE